MAAALLIATPNPASGQAECAVPADPSWSAVEAAAWERMCLGDWADFQDGEHLDPTVAEGWTAERVLSSSFIEQLLDPQYASVISRHGVLLRGAWLPGGLDLHEAHVPFPLRCQECRIAALSSWDAAIDGPFDLRGSAVAGDVQLENAEIASHLGLGTGTVVSGGLRLQGVKVSGHVFLDQDSEFEEVSLRYATVGGALALGNGTVVSGAVDAEGVNITGNALLAQGSEFGEVSLRYATVGGALALGNGSVVSGLLDAEGAYITGNVLLAGGSEFGEVRLRHSEVGGSVTASEGTVVTDVLDVGGAELGGSVFLGGGSEFGEVRLAQAVLGGSLSVDNGTVVTGVLDAEGVQVTGNALLHGGSEFSEVDLSFAEIGGSLNMSNGTVVSETLTATSVTIASFAAFGRGTKLSEVRLGYAEIGGALLLGGTEWQTGSALELQSTRVGGLWADGRADRLPETLHLNGFTFQEWIAPDPRTLGSRWFTSSWLGRQNFSPGPYDHLADVMRASGHPTIASDISFSRSHTERRAYGLARPQRWGLELHRLVLGYGYRPWRALWWALLAVAAGYVVLRAPLRFDPDDLQHRSALAASTPRDRVRAEWSGGIQVGGDVRWSSGEALLYSVDRLLPAITLMADDGLPARTPAQEHWFAVQHLLGWLLTLFIIGWLTRLLV